MIFRNYPMMSTLSVQQSPFPRRLKEARKAKKISQKNLGILAGIDEFSSSGRMNHYEKGRHVPDYSLLSRIADILDVPVPYFYCEDDQLADLLVAYHRLPKTQQSEIARAIEALRQKLDTGKF